MLRKKNSCAGRAMEWSGSAIIVSNFATMRQNGAIRCLAGRNPSPPGKGQYGVGPVRQSRNGKQCKQLVSIAAMTRGNISAHANKHAIRLDPMAEWIDI